MDRTSALLQFLTARQTKGLPHDDLHRAIPTKDRAALEGQHRRPPFKGRLMELVGVGDAMRERANALRGEEL